MMQRIARKLKSRAGESIGETMIALLISSLALVMLAGAISTATRLVVTGKNRMGDYYTQDSQMVHREGDFNSVSIRIENKDDVADRLEAQVNYYENAAFEGAPVYAYYIDSTENP